jgi:hypothetical protein
MNRKITALAAGMFATTMHPSLLLPTPFGCMDVINRKIRGKSWWRRI